MVIGSHRIPATNPNTTPADPSSIQTNGQPAESSIKATGYLHIDDVEGESTDAGHQEWINLDYVGFGIHRTQGGNSHEWCRARSSAQLQNLVCHKYLDSSTPKLQRAIADGANFPTVKIDICTSSGGDKRVPYLQWELKNVRVCHYSIGGHGDSNQPPKETIAFNYEEITMVYDKLDKNNKSQGKLDFHWKVEEGTN